MDDFDSPFSCPQCGCDEVRWAAPMGTVFVACSCRACGWEYLIEQIEALSDALSEVGLMVEDKTGWWSGVYEVSKEVTSEAEAQHA